MARGALLRNLNEARDRRDVDDAGLVLFVDCPASCITTDCKEGGTSVRLPSEADESPDSQLYFCRSGRKATVTNQAVVHARECQYGLRLICARESEDEPLETLVRQTLSQPSKVSFSMTFLLISSAEASVPTRVTGPTMPAWRRRREPPGQIVGSATDAKRERDARC